MKAVLETINQVQSNSFCYKIIELYAFDAPFHYHPEYELTWIQKGEGQRYVGSKLENFIENDLILLGSNLPHCWISKPSSENEKVTAVVLQFKRDFLGTDFIDLPEMHKVKRLLKLSKSGLKISGSLSSKIQRAISEMQFQSDYQKLLSLLFILGLLADSDHLEPIDQSFSEMQHSDVETLRFQRVFAYLITHYKEEISLQRIAEIAHLSPTSFCRYFKGITGKTFFDVVNEYRIQNACQLLKKKQLSVSQIAFESGFNDVPYFNKLFKKLKGVNPLGYVN